MRTAASRLIAACASLLAVTPAFAQQKWDGTPIATTVYVNFASGSANFRPTEASVATLSEHSGAEHAVLGAQLSGREPCPQRWASALQPSA